MARFDPSAATQQVLANTPNQLAARKQYVLLGRRAYVPLWAGVGGVVFGGMSYDLVMRPFIGVKGLREGRGKWHDDLQ
jgi:hypothetical protein